MPKLLKRGKASTEEDAATAADSAPTEAVVEAHSEPEPELEPEPEPERAPQATSFPASPASTPGGGPSSGGRAGLLGRMYGNPGEMSRAERERQAAAEFEQAVAPVMDLLVASVPEASSPDEAAQAWEARGGELRPDPAGGAYIPGDRFEREARVYYRLLRRDYEKNPRPSLTKKSGLTHHLHTQYNRFPGTKGW